MDPKDIEQIAALRDDHLRVYVDDILRQIDRDERRSRRIRMLIMVCALAVAWCMGAACAAQAVCT